MAINDILAQSGDKQDFIVELPVGNASYFPVDVVTESDGALLCSEIPEITNSGGNIFIMSE